jgi:hypothetical protein
MDGTRADRMPRMTDGIIVALLLVLAGYLYSQEHPHATDALTGRLPRAVAGPVQAFERGRGPNLASQVAIFTGGRWRLDQVAIVPGAAVAPDGSKTADRLVETSDYDRHRIEAAVSGVTPGQVYTLSVFVKPAGRIAMQFEMRGEKPGKSSIVQFNFNDAAVTYAGGDVSDAGVQALPGGWFRCWAAMPYSGDTAVFNFALLGWQSAATYRGNESAGLLIWGVQFELGDRPRGYAGAEKRAAQ